MSSLTTRHNLHTLLPIVTYRHVVIEKASKEETKDHVAYLPFTSSTFPHLPQRTTLPHLRTHPSLSLRTPRTKASTWHPSSTSREQCWVCCALSKPLHHRPVLHKAVIPYWFALGLRSDVRREGRLRRRGRSHYAAPGVVQTMALYRCVCR